MSRGEITFNMVIASMRLFDKTGNTWEGIGIATISRFYQMRAKCRTNNYLCMRKKKKEKKENEEIR